MAIFHQLPDSVLQLLAVFLSIIIEALPFVLLGSILSGFIEVFVTPEKVQNFLPKIRSWLFSLELWLVLFSPLVSVGLFPLSRPF